MKTYLALIILPFFLFTPLYPVFAQDATIAASQKKIEARNKKVAAREAVLKAKLLRFKDQKKAGLVERVNTNLAKVNQNRTDNMASNLEQMSKILTRLGNRITEASQGGQNTTQAKQALDIALASVQRAKETVATQSAKDYVLNVTGESKAKEAAQKSREQLHIDLKLSHDLVVEARKAVANAIKVTASSLQGVKNGQ